MLLKFNEYSPISSCNHLSYTTSSPLWPLLQNTKSFQIKQLYLEPLEGTTSYKQVRPLQDSAKSLKSIISHK